MNVRRRRGMHPRSAIRRDDVSARSGTFGGVAGTLAARRRGTAFAVVPVEGSRKRRSIPMTNRNELLLQSVLGHLALLAEKYPKKAASPVARKAKMSIEQALKINGKKGLKQAA